MAMEWRLYYDGGCNLCHVSQLRVERWALRRGRQLVPLPLQSDEAQDKGYPMDAMILEKNGAVYAGADAWLELLEIAPWYLRWLFPLRKIRPLRAILAWGYRIVERYRIKWFGSRECRIPARH